MLKDFFKNSVVYALANIVQKIIDYLANFIFIYFLPAFEYGIMTLLPLIVMIMAPLLSFQLGSSVTRYYYKYLKTNEADLFLGNILSYMFIVLFILSVFFIFCSRPIWNVIFPEISFMPYIVIGILITAADSINRMYITILQIKRQVKFYAIFNNCYILFRILLIVIAVYVKQSAYSYYLAYLFAVSLFIPITLYFMRADIKWNLKRKYIKESMKYASYILPVSVFIIANTFIDRHVIMTELDLQSMGIYSAGVNIGQIIYFMAMVFNIACLPFFMQMYEDDKDSFKIRIEPVYKVIFFVLNVSACVLSLLSPFLIYILPATYHEAIVVIPFIAFLGVAQGLYQLYTNILSLDTEMLRFKIIGVISSLLINIPLSYYLVHTIGILGAAISSLSCMYISAFVYKIIVRKTKGPDLSSSFFVLPVFVFLATLFLLRLQEILPLYGTIFAYIIAIGILFCYFNNLYFKRKNYIIDFLKEVYCYVKINHK